MNVTAMKCIQNNQIVNCVVNCKHKQYYHMWNLEMPLVMTGILEIKSIYCLLYTLIFRKGNLMEVVKNHGEVRSISWLIGIII